MKSLSALLSLVCTASGLAGEASLQKTYQPLLNIGQGGIRIAEVTCVDWYSHSRSPTGIGLISAKNIPPANNERATEDLNAASRCGIVFSVNAEEGTSVTLDASKFKPDEYFGGENEKARETVLRASLECLRRVLPEKLKKVKVGLVAKDADKVWIEPILKQFNSADRNKPFFVESSE